MKKQLVKEENRVRYFNNGDWINLSNISTKRNKNDWENNILKSCDFGFNGKEYSLTILEYFFDKKKIKIKISGIDEEFIIPSNSMIACGFGECLNKESHSYHYEIGKNINGLVIIDQIRLERTDKKCTEKGYVAKCLIDGYVGEYFESAIDRGCSCRVCNNITVSGINDVHTTHNHMVKFFANIEDSKKHSYGSNKKVLVKCPHCKSEKYMKVCDLFKFKGVTCNICSDGVRFPNKLMGHILKSLNVKFKPELNCTDFKWCESYKYDYYLPDYKIIIELDGSYGHGKHDIQKYTKEEQLNRDSYKDKIALENDVYVIRIDCDYSGYNNRESLIKDNIINSKLRYILDFKNVDFDCCIEKSYSSNILLACEMFNNGKDINTISDELNTSYGTALEYIKKCAKLNMCDYSKLEYRKMITKKGVLSKAFNDFIVKIDPVTNLIIKTYECHREIKDDGFRTVSKVLSGRQKQTKGYIFMYQKDWFALQKQIYNLA